MCRCERIAHTLAPHADQNRRAPSIMAGSISIVSDPLETRIAEQCGGSPGRIRSRRLNGQPDGVKRVARRPLTIVISSGAGAAPSGMLIPASTLPLVVMERTNPEDESRIADARSLTIAMVDDLCRSPDRRAVRYDIRLPSVAAGRDLAAVGLIWGAVAA